jgi:23S rRNA pseudouridine1911/1915/1917 synthase
MKAKAKEAPKPKTETKKKIVKTAKQVEIPILFENDDLLIINKPAGLAVHPDGKRVEYTLVDWILEKYPEIINVGEVMETEYKGEPVQILRPGIVHRLDRETTGVMAIAKTELAYGFLKKKFKEHKVKKTYRAFVYGHIKNDLGTVDAPIGRSVDDIRKWNAGRGARGDVKQAKTMYRVINRFETNEIIDTAYTLKQKNNTRKILSKQSPDAVVSEFEKVTYVECYPQTGRTHQIRVHMRFINHPIVSDFLYADKKPKALDFKRVALHAYKLELPLPNGGDVSVMAELPADFKKVVKKYGLK